MTIYKPTVVAIPSLKEFIFSKVTLPFSNVSNIANVLGSNVFQTTLPSPVSLENMASMTLFEELQ